MYCKHCGKQIKDGAKFCQYCGQSVERAETPEEPTWTQEPEIEEAEEETAWSQEDYTETEDYAETEEEQTEQPESSAKVKPQKSPKPLIAAISILCVIILGAGAVVGFMNDRLGSQFKKLQNGIIADNVAECTEQLQEIKDDWKSAGIFAFGDKRMYLLILSLWQIRAWDMQPGCGKLRNMQIRQKKIYRAIILQQRNTKHIMIPLRN